MSATENYVGIVTAIVATLRGPDGRPLVDLDGDAWLPTAFRDGQPVALAAAEHGDHYNHTPRSGAATSSSSTTSSSFTVGIS